MKPSKLTIIFRVTPTLISTTYLPCNPTSPATIRAPPNQRTISPCSKAFLIQKKCPWATKTIHQSEIVHTLQIHHSPITIQLMVKEIIIRVLRAVIRTHTKTYQASEALLVRESIKAYLKVHQNYEC